MLTNSLILDHPKLIYKWQVYPLVLTKVLPVGEKMSFYFTGYWGDVMYPVVLFCDKAIFNADEISRMLSEPNELMFYEAHKIMAAGILENSPIVTCAEPPSVGYRPCHCGADCYRLGDDPLEPCWGKVGPMGLSGDDDFCHACEGHAMMAMFSGEWCKAKP